MQINNNMNSSTNFGMALKIKKSAAKSLMTANETFIKDLEKSGKRLKGKHVDLEVTSPKIIDVVVGDNVYPVYMAQVKPKETILKDHYGHEFLIPGDTTSNPALTSGSLLEKGTALAEYVSKYLDKMTQVTKLMAKYGVE